MKFNLKKLINLGLVALSLVTLTTGTASAKHVHHHARHHIVRVIKRHRHYHYNHKRHHVYKHHKSHKHYIKHIKFHFAHADSHVHHVTHVNPVHHSLSYYNNFAHETAIDEFNDVNNAREAHGLSPLSSNNDLQRIADMRAGQALNAENNPLMNSYDAEQNNGNASNADDLAHGFTNHETPNDDANALGINLVSEFNSTVGENEAPTIGIGNFAMSADNCGDPAYTDKDDTPSEVASNNVRDMLDYDKNSGNGHRANILNPNAHYLAVSSTFNPNESSAKMDTVEEYEY